MYSSHQFSSPEEGPPLLVRSRSRTSSRHHSKPVAAPLSPPNSPPAVPLSPSESGSWDEIARNSSVSRPVYRPSSAQQISPPASAYSESTSMGRSASARRAGSSSSGAGAVSYIPPLPSHSSPLVGGSSFMDSNGSTFSPPRPRRTDSATRQQLKQYIHTATHSPSPPSSDFEALPNHPPPKPYFSGGGARRATTAGPEAILKARNRDLDERRGSLQPRSAVANYFNIDFSFLDDEPPPGTGSSKGHGAGKLSRKSSRPSSASSKLQESMSRPFAGSVESFESGRSSSWSSPADVLYGNGRPQSSGTIPGSPSSTRSTASRLPFPSRPSSARRPPSVESSSGLSRSKSVSSPSSNRASYPRMPLDPHINGLLYEQDLRRPSVASSFASGISADSSGLSSSRSSIPDGGYSGWAGVGGGDYSMKANRRISGSGARNDPSTEEEKRQRLVMFLDETAAAMEGGKSLAMVLPETDHAGTNSRTLSELAETMVSPTTPSARFNQTPRFSKDVFTSTDPSTPHTGRAESPSPRSATFPASVTTPINRTSSPFNPAYHPGASVSPFAASTASPRDSIHETASPRVVPRPRASPLHEVDRPETVYFTPTISQHGSAENDDKEKQDEDEADIEAIRNGDLGLGLDIHVSQMPAADHDDEFVRTPAPPRTDRLAPVHERSPSTVRGMDSPSPTSNLMGAIVDSVPASGASFAAEASAPWEPVDPAEAEARRVKEKMREKRRMIIMELIETEASYACDMAIVRDIWLARARGMDLNSIAEHVMSSGLGLGKSMASPPTPPPSATSSSFPNLGPSKNDLRRPTLVRRPSAQPSLSQPGEPLMSPKDLHTIFANLEEISGLAEAFASILESAWNNGRDNEDRIGEVFVEMLPRIQQVYSVYCVRHHRAIVRLQELGASLKTYIAECTALSTGRTGAWDLPSLLIKPVQRCLKYPLLLESIAKVTPEDHPDRTDLLRAVTDMAMVADHINEVKARDEPVLRVKKELSQRRESTASVITKKLLGGGSSSKKPKTPTMYHPFAESENHEMFDSFTSMVDNTRSTVLRLETEMREQVRKQKATLDSHTSMVEGWIEMYAKGGESHSGGYERLCYFLDNVLKPLLDGTWRNLDHEVRRSLLVKTEHLLSLFENPRSIISKRNDKLLDHSRYLAKRLPSDKRASEEFVTLSSQLLNELPGLLTNLNKYLTIIHSEWDAINVAYSQEVVETWTRFSEHFAHVQEDDDSGNGQTAINSLMDTLASGLHMSISHSNSPIPPLHNRVSTPSQRPLSSSSSVRRASRAPAYTPSPPSTEVTRSRHNNHRQGSGSVDYGKSSGTNRSSLNSNASTAPSFTLSTGTNGSSNGTPNTPPPPPAAALKRYKMNEHESSVSPSLHQYRLQASPIKQNAYHPLPPVPQPEEELDPRTGTPHGNEHETETDTDAEADEDQFDEDAANFARPRPVQGRALPGSRDSRIDSRLLSAYSVYVAAEESFDDDYDEDEDQEPSVLYIAMAMASSRSSSSRNGHPVLSYDIGDKVHVIHEEADKADGGAGWLLGSKEQTGDLGWVRTEHFHLVD
ncbi:hypothetical protein T439DRAFT_323969 [Meredithblackwellia eburnea MCA 4105]